MIAPKGFKKISFSQLATNWIRQIVQSKVEQQLSGLSPAERGEVLKNILISRHPDGSSLKVHIASQSATDLEFGTSKTPARPWVKKMQCKLAAPVKAVLAQLLTPKK